MTFSIELLPAPLGPMMARTSCSRTSNVTSASAFTPPNASEMRSSDRMTSPMRRAGVVGMTRASGGLRHCGGLHAGIVDAQVGSDHAGAAVLELHDGFDVLHAASGVQRVDQRGVFLR